MRALGTMSTPGSCGLVSPTVAPYPPSTDYTSDDLMSAKIMPWLRPELCNSPASEAAPIRSAPSCWLARPLPACGACEPAFVRAKNPLVRRVCLPALRRRYCHLWTPREMQAVFEEVRHIVGCCHLSGL